jgi:DeoR/GlpR family transcriptional regulator of sugar metabolism
LLADLHGGAVLPSIAARDNSFAHRFRDAPEARTRLAEAAFALLAPGETCSSTHPRPRTSSRG